MYTFQSIAVFLVIGLIAGWLAAVWMKGRGFGVLGDILVGIVGAEIGGWIFSVVGLSAYGFVGALFIAFVGALVLLAIIKLTRTVAI